MLIPNVLGPSADEVWTGNIVLAAQYSPERVFMSLAYSCLAGIRGLELHLLSNLLYRREVDAFFKWQSVAAMGASEETSEPNIGAIAK